MGAIMGEFGLFWDDEKPKRTKIPKDIRMLVWQKYNKSSMTGKCYCCGCPITYRDFDVGHNKAVSKYGKGTVSNLRPICRPCNRGMGTQTIESYKKKHFSKPKKKVKKKVKVDEDFFGNPVYKTKWVEEMRKRKKTKTTAAKPKRKTRKVLTGYNMLGDPEYKYVPVKSKKARISRPKKRRKQKARFIWES